MNIFALAEALGVPFDLGGRSRPVDDPNSPEVRAKVAAADARREKRRQKALRNAPIPKEDAPFERLASMPQRTPPDRFPVPQSPFLMECASGSVGGFRPELPGLIAPLVGVEAPEAQYMAVGYALRLARPEPGASPNTDLLLGELSEQTRALRDFVLSFDPILVGEVEAALSDRAEELLELLESVSKEDEVPCDQDLALKICRLRSEAAMIEIGLRMYGRVKPYSLKYVDALGVGCHPWLRDAIGDSTADEADRWSEELIEAPDAWWAEAMLAD